MAKLRDNCKIVVMAPPQNIQSVAIDGSTYLLGDYINLAEWGHVTLLFIGGSMSATSAITLWQAKSAAGASEKAFTNFTSRDLITATSLASDTPVATAVTSGIWTWPATNYLTNIIDIDTIALDDLFTWLRVGCGATGVGASYMCVVAILSEPRYIAGVDTDTAIA